MYLRARRALKVIRKIVKSAKEEKLGKKGYDVVCLNQ